MSNKKNRIAVIGAGIFGCNVALRLAESGHEVVLLERLPYIMKGTSANNTNRVHQGFHYPRGVDTAIECRDNYNKFEMAFSDALIDDCPNIYGIAEKDSKTSKEDFLKFCDFMKLTYSVIDLKNLDIQLNGCNLGVLCQETIIDMDTLRKLLKLKIDKSSNVKVLCNTEVQRIERITNQYNLYYNSNDQFKETFDAVINCSYSNINTLTEQLGYEIQEAQYEYTVIPIIDMDIAPIALTIMDGPFFTLFPHGKTKQFLLYHVDHSVIKREISKMVNPDWLDAEKSPLNKINKTKHFEKLIKSCLPFMPELVNAKLCGFLESPRMVLPKHEQDDARPSFINDYGEGYMTVFSGKIDRSLSIADSVCLKVNEHLKKAFIQI